MSSEEDVLVVATTEHVETRDWTVGGQNGALAADETLVRSRPPGQGPGLALPARIGRYEVRGLLGEGAMGRVYRAHDPLLRREVAVKTVKESFVRDATAMLRFHREAEVVSRLSHPGLVCVYDVGEGYIVLELVEGESLAALLARRGPPRPRDAIAILRVIAEALDHVHAQGVVHRDVKPSNVLVRSDGGVKVTDFGIARLAGAPLTRTGELLGSPAYMAPEQIALGEAEPASDIYALGVVAFETLTSRLPFAARSLGELLVRITVDPPPSASALVLALPANTDGVFSRVLAKEPADRFPTARAFVEALEVAVVPDSATR